MKKQTKPMICTKCGCEFEYDISAAKKERTSLGLYEIVNCPTCGDECVRKLGKQVTEQALNKLIDKFYEYTENAEQHEFVLLFAIDARIQGTNIKEIVKNQKEARTMYRVIASAIGEDCSDYKENVV